MPSTNQHVSIKIINNNDDTDFIDSDDEVSIKIEEQTSGDTLAVVRYDPLRDPLNVVLNYHFEGKGRSSLAREIFKQSGLLVVSILGVIFYYVPAKAYAESICADPSYKNIPCDFFLFNHIPCTMLVAGGILISATNTFFDRQKAEFIPQALMAYLVYPLAARQKFAENAAIFAGSFIASIPFMIITVANPIPGLPKALIISQAFVVGVTNTLLHLLPFKLALKNPLYRAPFLLPEFIYKQITKLLLSAEAKQQKKLQEQINQHHQTIKNLFIKHLDQAQRLLSIYGFSFVGCNYTNEIKNENIDQELTQSPLQLLTQLLNRLHKMSPDQTIVPSGRINNFFRQAIYFPGASLVILSCAGFWGGTFNEMTNLTGDPASGAVISAPSIYCLGVLLAFFGGNALQNSYDYLTAWKDDTVKIPMVFKLYPKTAVLLVMISMYLSAFSYAAGAQLINDNFNDKLDFLRPYLLELAKTGLTFLGFHAMIDFFTNLLSKFAQYCGAEDAQSAARLFEALSQMKDSIQLMKPNLLLESLVQADYNQVKSILNIKYKNDLQDVGVTLTQLAEKLKTKIIREIESMGEENEVGIKLILLAQLENDQEYSIKSIEALLTYFNTLESNLPLSLKEDCQEYRTVCELMAKLNCVNFVRELDTFPDGSDSYAAGPSSSEITPLLPPRAGGSIQGRFFHPPTPIRYYGINWDDNSRASSLSPPLLNSNQMGM